MRAALVALLLMAPALAAPGEWQETFSAGQAPQVAMLETDAWAQGGLVDVRYGQVSIDQGGTSLVLELPEGTRLTLDGSPIAAAELLKRIPEGLLAVVSYDREDGIVRLLEVFSSGRALPAADLRLLPWKGPAYGPKETVTVLLPASEVQRLGGGPFQVTVPGVADNLPLALPAQHGGRKAVLRVFPGLDLVDVPVLLTAGQKVFRGPRLSISTTPPAILDFGPSQASAKLASFPGWVDLRSASKLLDPSTAKLSASAGLRVVSFQPRVDRTAFELEADGPGEYWLEFSIADKMGRSVKQRWPLRVWP